MSNSFNDGDVYVNDGESYTNGVYYPQTQVEDLEEQNIKDAVVASSYPVMDDIADWFTTAIMDCDRISNINLESSLTAEEQIHAWQEVKRILMIKNDEFMEFGSER